MSQIDVAGHLPFYHSSHRAKDSGCGRVWECASLRAWLYWPVFNAVFSASNMVSGRVKLLSDWGKRLPNWFWKTIRTVSVTKYFQECDVSPLSTRPSSKCEYRCASCYVEEQTTCGSQEEDEVTRNVRVINASVLHQKYSFRQPFCVFCFVSVEASGQIILGLFPFSGIDWHACCIWSEVYISLLLWFISNTNKCKNSITSTVLPE